MSRIARDGIKLKNLKNSGRLRNSPTIGLTGLYDFKLHFSLQRLDVTPGAPTLPAGQAATLAAADPSEPSVFTAIQDLGLKLEAGKAPLDVLLIDSVQRPTEN